jgi:hypothetical protein
MKSFFYSLIVVLLSSNANAQWSTDTLVNMRISLTNNYQSDAKIVNSDSGNTIAIWNDRPTNVYSTPNKYGAFTQKISSKGEYLWKTDGVNICEDCGGTSIISDEKGGAFISYSSKDEKLYIQKINSNGELQWANKGIEIYSYSFDDRNRTSKLIYDGKGGAFVIFTKYAYYTKHIDSLGNIIPIGSIENGVRLNLGPCRDIKFLNNSIGGITYCWNEITDNNSTINTIYCQTIDSLGNLMWGTIEDPLTVCNTETSKESMDLVDDRHGGVIASWSDYNNPGIYAQRIDKYGNIYWPINGKKIAVVENSVLNGHSMINSGTDNFIFSWADSDYNERVLAQRIDIEGNVIWNQNKVIDRNVGTLNPVLISDNNSGAFIAYHRSGFRVQHINNQGEFIWDSAGITITSPQVGNYATSNKTGVYNPGSGAVFIWDDNRVHKDTQKVYIQNISFCGGVGLFIKKPIQIFGATTLCSGNTATYSVSPIKGAKSYIWSLPNGWTGSSLTNTITANVDTTSGDIQVRATTGCDTSEAASLSIKVYKTPPKPGLIDGLTTICAGTTNTYSIAPVEGATNYLWTLPFNCSGSSTTNVITINTYTASLSYSSQLKVVAATEMCKSTPSTVNVFVKPSIGKIGTIVGSKTICNGLNATYSISAVSGASSYTWVLPNSWSGASTTNTITITPDNSNGTISVTASNSCGTSTAATLTVSVTDIPAPAMPGNIIGLNTICTGTNNTYSIEPVTNASTYSWKLPIAWTGSSTTNIINTSIPSFAFMSGTITVKAENICGSSPASSIFINVNKTPSSPGSIAGNTTICTNNNYTYSINAVTNATSYNWTLPDGWSGNSITNTIQATPTLNGGTITVYASNNNCVSPSSSVFVKVGSATTNTIYPVACDSFISPSGKVLTANGTYNDTISNAVGCDSIITINLTVNQSKIGTDVITACDSYTWINGMTYAASNTTAKDTLTASSGCDSIVTLNLTINKSKTGTDVITACDAYTWINGITYTQSNTTAKDTLTASSGCDSIVTLNLTINKVSDVTTTVNNSNISSNNVSASNYQWIDCDNNNSIIAGETNKLYFPYTSGNYAVSITENGCVDTSDCANVNVTCFAKYKTNYDTLKNEFTLIIDSLSSTMAASYLWNFGDGATSSLKTPSHVYAVDTMYNVCVKITTGSNDTCSYCHTIGKDYMGNIIRLSGFTLSVIDPLAKDDEQLSISQATESGYKLYPNPTSGEVYILFNQVLNNGSIRITNMVGQTIEQRNNLTGNLFNFNIYNHSAGMYFIEVNQNGVITRTKLVKH